jgi:hypothetical protein
MLRVVVQSRSLNWVKIKGGTAERSQRPYRQPLEGLQRKVRQPHHQLPDFLFSLQLYTTMQAGVKNSEKT